MEDTTLDALQNELEFYRQNQSVMADEIRAVIGDNQKLSAHVGQLLHERQQTPAVADEHELRAQITLLTKERDSIYVLWQTSQKTIDALENELKTYQNYGDRGQMQNSNGSRRDMELKFETSLTDYIELETKYKASQAKFTSVEQELRNKESEIQTYKEKTAQLEIKIEELTKIFEECRINLGAEKKNNEDLRNQLNLCQKDIVDKVKKEAEAKTKVAEALQLFDVVHVQKNEAYKKICEMAEELAHVKQELASAKRNAESSYKAELDDLRNNYNEKIVDMLQHVRNLDSELVEKGMLLNKAMREIKILKEENKNYLRQQKDCLNAIDPKLQIAQQKAETMFQELVASERRNIQLACEKQCLAIEIQRIQDIHVRDIKRRDWEEGLLRTQCDELKMQVDHLQKSLEDTHGMVNKLQKMLSSRTELNQKIVSTKEEELVELNKHLENQMELSRKWKESYVEMTEKLKMKLEEMQKENTRLREQLRLACTSSVQDDNDSTS